MISPAHAPTTFFTVAPLVLVAVILVALRLLMAWSAANLFIAGFLACVIPSPLMLVAHANAAAVMLGIGLACLVPAFILAEDHTDGPSDGGEPKRPYDPRPDPGSDPDLWTEFERDFWAHVEQSGRLINTVRALGTATMTA